MRTLRPLVLAIALATQAGCFATTFTTGRPASNQHTERTLPFWFWGLSGAHEVDLDAICPGGVAKFQVVSQPIDTLFDTLTLGIYSPRTAVVECASQ